MSGWWSSETLSPEQEAEALKIKLNSNEFKKEDIDKISALLDKPEALQALKKMVDPSFSAEILTRLNKKSVLSEWDQAIMRLLAILYPEQALTTRLEQTNKPSGKVSAVLNGGGGAMNFEQLKTLSLEKIQELFRSINKGDLMAIARTIPDAKPASMDQASFDMMKWLVSATLLTMLENGMSIESQQDIDFLEKNGTDETRKTIEEFKSTFWPNAFENNKKFIIKGNTTQSVSGTDQWVLLKGIDISKINTVDLKTGAEQLKKQLPAWTDKVKMEEMIRNLLDSKSGALRGLWELMKIFGALLGLNLDKKPAPNEKVPELDKKRRYALMTNMRDGKNGYTLDEIFDEKWTIKISDKKDTKLQLYLSDIAKLKIAEWVPAKDTEGGYEMSTKLTDAINTYQKSLSLAPTWKIDKLWLPLIMAKFDVDGELLKAPNTAPEASPKEKHPLGERIVALEWKKYGDIKTILKWDPIPRNQIIELQKDLGFTPTNADKSRRLDGDIWPGTVKAFLERYPQGMKDKDIPKK